ncbi:MAG TPA: hypothetical protein PKH77_27815 [Anaerolineae bacterium]|nr:hypothetical protein [Anaerolineae bacterium]
MSKDRHSPFAIRHSPLLTPHSPLLTPNSPLAPLLLAFLALALAWNVIIPPYENLDEIEHAEVVRHIAVTGRLPVHGDAEAAGYHVGQEASQPPLYHVLAAGWARLWRLPLDPPLTSPIPGDVVTCGADGPLYNRATRTRDPYDDFPWRGATRTLHALRFFSTLLQTLTVAGMWTLARRVFAYRGGGGKGGGTPPLRGAPLLATALVAFNPQFLLVASGVNNDNAVTPLATWGLVLAFDLWDKGPSFRRVALLGVLSGLAGLSKLSGLALFGLGGLALLIRAVERKTSFRALVGWSALLVAIAGLLVAPWLLRNLRLYGDPTALAPMLAKVGLRDYPMDWNEVKLTALSYWGQLPCAFYPRALYWPYGLIMALGLIGVLVTWRRFTYRQKIALTLCAVWFGVITLAWVRWNLITPATGGRLLFPAIAALAFILAAGIAAIESRITNYVSSPTNREALIVKYLLYFTSRTSYFTVIILLWSLLMLRLGPVEMFTPPLRLPADTVVPNATDITFGESLTLRGYEVTVEEGKLIACWLTGRSPCTPVLDVTFYWQASAPIPADDVMALQLVSLAPGDTTLRFNYNHWIGRGNLPTSAMPVGTLLRDHYRLPLPATDLPRQAWTLQLVFTVPGTGERLPVAVDGVPIGDVAQLTRLRIPDPPPVPPFTVHPQASFGNDAVRLEEVQDSWRIELWWTSFKPLPDDYTVFVHAYAADGTLLGTGDGPPMGGRFPTSLWQPGDFIEDNHVLILPEGVTPAHIAVGLYHPITGERLPASPIRARVENNAAIIWENPSP